MSSRSVLRMAGNRFVVCLEPAFVEFIRSFRANALLWRDSSHRTTAQRQEAPSPPFFDGARAIQGRCGPDRACSWRLVTGSTFGAVLEPFLKVANCDLKWRPLDVELELKGSETVRDCEYLFVQRLGVVTPYRRRAQRPSGPCVPRNTQIARLTSLDGRGGRCGNLVDGERRCLRLTARSPHSPNDPLTRLGSVFDPRAQIPGSR